MAKKESKKAPAKVVQKKEKIAVKKSSAKFVSLTVRAVIPTQSYGNIQPEIAVQANTYEEARDFAMPLIEGLFAQYSETRPTFLGKVVESVRVVVPAKAGSDIKEGELVKEVQTPPATAPEATTPPAPEAFNGPTIPKPEPVLKAEKAIALAATAEAALIIQGQIEKSVKIPEEFKPDLITLVLKRRGDLK